MDVNSEMLCAGGVDALRLRLRESKTRFTFIDFMAAVLNVGEGAEGRSEEMSRHVYEQY